MKQLITQYVTPTTGTTVTVYSGIDALIINPAGTLAALTITLPAAAAANDGQKIEVSCSQVITALTVNAAAGSVVGAPSSLAVGSGFNAVCYGQGTSWFLKG